MQYQSLGALSAVGACALMFPALFVTSSPGASTIDTRPAVATAEQEAEAEVVSLDDIVEISADEFVTADGLQRISYFESGLVQLGWSENGDFEGTVSGVEGEDPLQVSYDSGLTQITFMWDTPLVVTLENTEFLKDHERLSKVLLVTWQFRQAESVASSGGNCFWECRQARTGCWWSCGFGPYFFKCKFTRDCITPILLICECLPF